MASDNHVGFIFINMLGTVSCNIGRNCNIEIHVLTCQTGFKHHGISHYWSSMFHASLHAQVPTGSDSLQPQYTELHLSARLAQSEHTAPLVAHAELKTPSMGKREFDYLPAWCHVQLCEPCSVGSVYKTYQSFPKSRHDWREMGFAGNKSV